MKKDNNDTNDFDFIRDHEISLKNFIFIFEPMLGPDEIPLFFDKIDEVDQNITWNGGGRVGSNTHIGTLHHLLVNPNGRCQWGGILRDDYIQLTHSNNSLDYILNHYEESLENLNYYVREFTSKNNPPQMVDGREYFNLPYMKNINESNDFDWLSYELKVDEDKPNIIPGAILDIDNSKFSMEEIMFRLHELGYKWICGETIYDDGRLYIPPFRYVYLGPMIYGSDSDGSLPELTILHDSNDVWIKENGLDHLVYKT